MALSTIGAELAALRRNYTMASLSETDVDPDPFAQLERWMQQALNSELPEPTAMTLATATPEGRPSARVVLLKGFDARGLVFYTNYESRKGREMEQNPQAALLFFWPELERQVRIEGRVERVSPDESLAYFQSRPKESQLGAWASPQSQVISGRDVVEQRYQELAAQFKHDEVLPLPPFWGGYRVVPAYFEFWQGRPSRMHDRICYTLSEQGWVLTRLAP
ncbi:MAG: pyridoxamine 5'-phosphate oxidase [Saprospiraceae bacterium]|nr:pyridoxamine 5'-phosphate oxidase [Saprospiraceae bacterium]MDW8230251.1 pyridoxamine 5'-phosphate oxidase [Saprospiraceae bacterium]